jgi:hypothetical protein
VLDAIRADVASLVSTGAKDTDALEKELTDLRAEQKRLARAVATAGDDIPELRLRNDRIRRLEANLAPARRTPAAVGDLLARAEEAAHKKLADLRKSLEGDLPTLRAALRALFPEGLAFRARGEHPPPRVGDLGDGRPRQSQIGERPQRDSKISEGLRHPMRSGFLSQRMPNRADRNGLSPGEVVARSQG